MSTNRIRIRFAKVGKVRFTSHRDLARIWERAMRKANVRVAYSEGFSPRPKLHFGLALSTGHESQAEYLDVDLVDEVRLDELATRLDPVLTPGVTVTGAEFVASGTPSLQEDVVACRWAFTLDGETDKMLDLYGDLKHPRTGQPTGIGRRCTPGCFTV